MDTSCLAISLAEICNLDGCVSICTSENKFLSSYVSPPETVKCCIYGQYFCEWAFSLTGKKLGSTLPYHEYIPQQRDARVDMRCTPVRHTDRGKVRKGGTGSSLRPPISTDKKQPHLTKGLFIRYKEAIFLPFCCFLDGMIVKRQ